jgi:hypothetical protein
MTTNHLATLVGAVTLVAITCAPVAAAKQNQPNVSCEAAGQSSTVCETPGDVEVKSAPPPVTYYPYGSPPPTAG